MLEQGDKVTDFVDLGVPALCGSQKWRHRFLVLPKRVLWDDS